MRPLVAYGGTFKVDLQQSTVRLTSQQVVTGICQDRMRTVSFRRERHSPNPCLTCRKTNVATRIRRITTAYDMYAATCTVVRRLRTDLARTATATGFRLQPNRLQMCRGADVSHRRPPAQPHVYNHRSRTSLEYDVRFTVVSLVRAVSRRQFPYFGVLFWIPQTTFLDTSLGV